MRNVVLFMVMTLIFMSITALAEASVAPVNVQMLSEAQLVSNKEIRKNTTIPKSLEDYIMEYYPKAVATLTSFGIKGPLAEELAKYAILRQILEDGPGRHPDTSIVGMYPGGVNKDVIGLLGLIPGKVNDKGHKLGTVHDTEGQACYAIYGPEANVQSIVAICLWYEKVITEWYTTSFKPEDIDCFHRSKYLSREIAHKMDTAGSHEEFYALSATRTRILSKANNMYGPGGSHVSKQVMDLDKIFYKALHKEEFNLSSQN